MLYVVYVLCMCDVCGTCMWEACVWWSVCIEQLLRSSVLKQNLSAARFHMAGSCFSFLIPGTNTLEKLFKRKMFYLVSKFQKLYSMARLFHCCGPETRLKYHDHEHMAKYCLLTWWKLGNRERLKEDGY